MTQLCNTVWFFLKVNTVYYMICQSVGGRFQKRRRVGVLSKGITIGISSLSPKVTGFKRNK